MVLRTVKMCNIYIYYRANGVVEQTYYQAHIMLIFYTIRIQNRLYYLEYYSGVYYRLVVVIILCAYVHTRRVRGNRTAHLAADQIIVRDLGLVGLAGMVC